MLFVREGLKPSYRTLAGLYRHFGGDCEALLLAINVGPHIGYANSDGSSISEYLTRFTLQCIESGLNKAHSVLPPDEINKLQLRTEVRYC